MKATNAGVHHLESPMPVLFRVLIKVLTTRRKHKHITKKIVKGKHPWALGMHFMVQCTVVPTYNRFIRLCSGTATLPFNYTLRITFSTPNTPYKELGGITSLLIHFHHRPAYFYLTSFLYCYQHTLLMFGWRMATTS